MWGEIFSAIGLVGILFLSIFSLLIFAPINDENERLIYLEEAGITTSLSVQLVDGWSRTGSGGSAGQQSDAAYAVEVDSSDNIYVTGTFTGVETFGTHTISSVGGSDIFLAKLSSTGDWLWVLSGGSNADDVANTITVDSSDNPIIGGFIGSSGNFGNNVAETLGGNEIVVVKADSSGSWSWVATAGGVSDDTVNSISSHNDGTIFMTGQVENDASFGSISTTGFDKDAYVASLGPSGDWNWAKRFIGNDVDGGYSIISLGDAVIAGGDHWGNLEIDGNELSGGGGFLSSMNATSGELNWLTDMDGTPYAMESDSSGNLYLAGVYSGAKLFGNEILTSEGDLDIFLGKLSADSTWIWAISAGSADWDSVGDLAVNGAGQVIVIGTYGNQRDHSDMVIGNTTLTSHEYSDVYLATASTNGNWIGAINGYSDSEENGLGIAVDSNDEVIAVGYFAGLVRDSLMFYDTNLDTHLGGIEHMFTWKFMWDSDGDGIAAIYDNCPQGVTDWTSDWQTDHDSDGCFDPTEDDDDDGDGLSDLVDTCSKGYNLWTSTPQTDPNGDGCEDDHEGSYTQDDIDADGIVDELDPDPTNPAIRTVPSHLYSNITNWPRTASQFCDNQIISCNDSPIKYGWFDFDGDGDLDYAVAGSVFRQVDGAIEGISSWSDGCTSFCGNGIAVSDYNRDGNMDLSTSKGIYLSYENGLSQDPEWEYPVDIGVTVVEIDWFDLDKDGHDDVYIGTAGDKDILRMSNGGGVSTGYSVDMSKSGITADVRLVDMNGDSWVDIVRLLNNGGFDVFYNQNGFFSNVSNFSSGVIPSSSGMAVGDFDADGEIDIAISTRNNKEDYIYRNNITTSNREYTMDWNSLDGSDSSNVVVGDVDGDGDLDITFGERTYLNPSGSISTDGDLDGINDVYESASCKGVSAPYGIWFSTSKLDYDSDGCHDLIQDNDDDGDGVPDLQDNCGRGETNWEPTILTDFDEDGCNDYLEDDDDDDDGVLDIDDECPNTESVLSDFVDDDGCDPSGKDSDGDGYADSIDLWDDDATQWLDSDGDGYGDNILGTNGDSCNITKGFSNIDVYGCPDSDGDGISNSGEYSGCEYKADCDNDGQSDSEDPCPLDSTNSCDFIDCNTNPLDPDCNTNGTNNSNVTNNTTTDTNNTANSTIDNNSNQSVNNGGGADSSSESLFEFEVPPELYLGLGILFSIMILVGLIRLTKQDPDDWEDDDEEDYWEEEQRQLRKDKLKEKREAEKLKQMKKNKKTKGKKSRKKEKTTKEQKHKSSPSKPPKEAPNFPPSGIPALPPLEPPQTPRAARPSPKPQDQQMVGNTTTDAQGAGFKAPSAPPPSVYIPPPDTSPSETVVKKLKATAVSRRVSTTYGDPAEDEGVYFKQQDSYWPTVDMQGAKGDDGYEWLEFPESSGHWWYRKQKGHEWGYWES